MPDKTPEQVAFEKAGDELVTAFGVLTADDAIRVKADADYETIAGSRASDLAAFVAANEAFTAAPQDPSLLQKLIDTIGALTASSQKQQSLKTAKDEADQVDTEAATSHQQALAEFNSRVAAFVAANTPAGTPANPTPAAA